MDPPCGHIPSLWAGGVGVPWRPLYLWLRGGLNQVLWAGLIQTVEGPKLKALLEQLEVDVTTHTDETHSSPLIL